MKRGKERDWLAGLTIDELERLIPLVDEGARTGVVTEKQFGAMFLQLAELSVDERPAIGPVVSAVASKHATLSTAVVDGQVSVDALRDQQCAKGHGDPKLRLRVNRYAGWRALRPFVSDRDRELARKLVVPFGLFAFTREVLAMRRTQIVLGTAVAVGVALLLAPSRVESGPSCPGRSEPIFEDDFERARPALPDKWQLVYDGARKHGRSQDARGGKQSFTFEGRPGWSAVAVRPFTSDAPLLLLEFAIKIPDANRDAAPGAGPHPGFFYKRSAWGDFAALGFAHATLSIVYQSRTIGHWRPGAWTDIAMRIDRIDNTIDVWIDGRHAGQHLPLADGFDPSLISGIALVAAHEGRATRYDNVTLTACRRN